MKDLMKPRYKVIALWIKAPLKISVGDILNWDDLTNDFYCKGERFTKKDIEGYPHLFKPLQWWEERKESELPEYIKFYEPLPTKFSIWKVNEWRFGLKHPLVKTDCDIVWRELSIADLPSTESEYLQSKEAIKQIK